MYCFSVKKRVVGRAERVGFKMMGELKSACEYETDKEKRSQVEIGRKVEGSWHVLFNVLRKGRPLTSSCVSSRGL